MYSVLLALAYSSLFILHSSLLISCSKDEAADSKTEKSTDVQLMSCVAGYEEVNRTNRANETHGITRTWLPPTNYSLYELGDDQSISVFFTQPAAAGEERFFFTSAGKWKVSGEELAGGTYHLYGYVPHNKSINTTVGLLPGDGKTYADGAVLTMANVPTVSSADLCVMIAAKNGKDDYKPNADYSVTGLQPGDFQYVAPGGEGGNYVYLLFDHLFSALRVQMRVQGDYAALRTIKLKSLRLQACVGSTPTKKKTNITVTLNKTTDGTSPITNVVFTPDMSSGDSDGVIVESTDGIELTTDFQPFQSHFMPAGVTRLNLISMYDVYDRKGNLIRQNDEAINTIDIHELFTGQDEALRGRRYTINLTINPTYLYMLSEPDLDDPTVEIDN
jgi:hypothetical protein